MSDYWSVYCHTCKESSHTDINRGEEKLRALVKLLPAIEQLREADINGILEIQVEYYGPELIDFCLTHKGHDLAIHDEYGHVDEHFTVGGTP